MMRAGKRSRLCGCVVCAIVIIVLVVILKPYSAIMDASSFAPSQLEPVSVVTILPPEHTPIMTPVMNPITPHTPTTIKKTERQLFFDSVTGAMRASLNWKFTSMTLMRWEFPENGRKIQNPVVYRTQPHWDWIQIYEPHVMEVFKKVAWGTTDCLVLDIGANDGHYTHMSAASGCNVISFEPQVACHDYLNLGILANGLSDQVKLIPQPVHWSPAAINASMKLGECSGVYSVTKNVNADIVLLHPVVLDSFLPKGLTITLAKIDTEGFEAQVVKGALGLLRKHQIENLLIEITSEMWPIKHEPAGIETMQEILKAGYSGRCLGRYRYYNRNPSNTPLGPTPTFTNTTLDEFKKAILLPDPCIDWHFYLN